LAESARHNTEKADPAISIISAFQPDLILIWRIVIHPLRPPAGAGSIRHSKAEKNEDACERQYQANDIESGYHTRHCISCYLKTFFASAPMTAAALVSAFLVRLA
jgi:hypothetical protein